jgi:lauroyl/myristoyl acyltransferase
MAFHEMNRWHPHIMFVKEMGLWAGVCSLQWLFRRIPIGHSYRLAGLLSFPTYHLAIRRRKILREELKRLFGPRFNEYEIQKIIQRAFGIYLKRQVENLVFDRMTEDNLGRVIIVKGWKNFHRVEKARKGVIILLAHFGSFMLPLPFLGYKGYRVIQVAGKPLIHHTGFFGRRLFEERKRQSDKMPIQFFLSDRYLGPLVKALRKGDIAVIAFDGRTGGEMVPMRLLNRTAQFSTGPFKLAHRTGATLLPTFVIRGADNRHRLIFEPPIHFENDQGRENAVESSMKEFLSLFENYLLRYPCHFAMTLFSSREEAIHGLNPPLFIDGGPSEINPPHFSNGSRC